MESKSEGERKHARVHLGSRNTKDNITWVRRGHGDAAIGGDPDPDKNEWVTWIHETSVRVGQSSPSMIDSRWLMHCMGHV